MMDYKKKDSEDQELELKEKMESVGPMVGIMTGVSLSLVLSILGPIASGHFHIVAFLVSFLCSSVLSIIIGLFIPVKGIADTVCKKAGADLKKIGGRLLWSLMANLLFTPIISFFMVLMAYVRNSHLDSSISFHVMFVKNLLVSLPVGLIVVVIAMPFLHKMAYKVLKLDSKED